MVSRLVQSIQEACYNTVVANNPIAYTALQPALEEQQQEKEGSFATQHNNKDQEHAISQAMISDFKEAKEELSTVTKAGNHGGFAWGIRQMLFGGPSPQDRTAQPGKENGQTQSRTG